MAVNIKGIKGVIKGVIGLKGSKPFLDAAAQDKDLGWVYDMKLAIDKNNIRVNGKAVKLSPGMEVVAEIKTGQRRIIEYLLTPLLRYKQESIRER